MTDQLERLKSALADHYAIKSEIGSGGMATVYLAEDVKHHRQVAVKVLRSDIAQSLGAERFIREIEIAAQLQHPHILPLLDSGEADGFLYYVMPFVDGESLRDKLDREHELPVHEAVKILREVVDALAKAHGRGVVHRDIKPDNVMLSDGHAVVMDFGVAKAVSEATGRQNITTAGVALGTPTYMAPEQAVADPHVDHRADLYAVGVMAYEMLAGRPPFEGGTPQAVLSAHVTQTPEPVTSHREAVPPLLSSVVMRCLEKKAADRWQSAADLRTELEKLSTPSGGTAPISAATAPVRRRSSMMIALVAVAVIVVAGALWVGRGGSSTVVVSAQRMAVIPFAPTVDDSALFRLGRDMVVLLSRNLDGVGDITMVDASTVLSRVTDQGRGLSLDEAAEVTRAMGASSFVHGRFVRTGNQIILDVTLNESNGGRELGRASVTAGEDDVVALTDSVTWALLASVWRDAEADAPTPSLGAVTTRSLPALRAFLDGEAAVNRGEWFRAPDLFRTAFEADSSFVLAYFRHWEARSWMSNPTDSEIVEYVREHRGELPERERLLVDARFTPNLEARLEIGRELTDRFPDYWPGWMEYGDRIVHFAPYIGYNAAEARQPFERVLEINPAYLPAWEHLAYTSMAEWDITGALAALDTLESLATGDDTYYGPEFFLSSRRSLEGQAGTLQFTAAEIDSLANWGINFGREIGDPFAIGATAQSGEQLIQIMDRALELSSRPDENRAARIVQATASASIGAWSDALDRMDQVLAIDPSVETRLTAYRLAALGRWVEGVSQGDVVTRRPEDLMADTTMSMDVRAELVWWDGAIALVNQDSEALSHAQVAMRALDPPDRGYLDSTLSAYRLALSGQELDAGRILASLELNADHAPWRRGGATRNTSHVNRLAAAGWLTANGAPEEAERLLRHTDAVIPNVELMVSLIPVWSVSVLQRGRAAEVAGRTDDAIDYYNRFLVTYSRPDASHQHLRDEAEAALARLTAEGN